MGYIEEFIQIANEIKEVKYSKKINIFQKIMNIHLVNKLKRSLDKIDDNSLTTKFVSEYADFYLQEFHLSSDMKNNIRQILKGRYENAGSITFEFSMPDDYIGSVTINFLDRYSTVADYIFAISGPNSINRLVYTDRNISIYQMQVKDDHYLDSIGKTHTDKLSQLKYIYVTTVVKEIKEFLLSSIEIKEISVDG